MASFLYLNNLSLQNHPFNILIDYVRLVSHSPSGSPRILSTRDASKAHVAIFRLLIDTALMPGKRRAMSICFVELTATMLCIPKAVAILWKYMRSWQEESEGQARSALTTQGVGAY